MSEIKKMILEKIMKQQTLGTMNAEVAGNVAWQILDELRKGGWVELDPDQSLPECRMGYTSLEYRKLNRWIWELCQKYMIEQGFRRVILPVHPACGDS